MISKFFIDRPIFAVVISLIISILGIISIVTLPVAKYPQVTPPQVRVSASYPGANAEVIGTTVASVIERQMVGVDNLVSLESSSNDNGTYSLTAQFETGSDGDMDTVNTQNRVSQVSSTLPSEVTATGVTVQKSTSSMAMVFALTSPNGSYDETFMKNYATQYFMDALKSVPGIGSVQEFGSDYAMRIWLNPMKMSILNVTPTDVISAISAQNTQAAVGTIGAQPSANNQTYQYTMRTDGRLQTAEQFKNVIIRTNTDGTMVRVGDVAEVNLGSKDYSVTSKLGGSNAAGFMISLTADANAMQSVSGAKAVLEKAKESFPSDMDYAVVYDSTKFIRASIEEVIQTFIEALLLVALIVYLFLQSGRSTLIPLIAVPVSLLGTFALFKVLDFSINTLTLFAMVLAIGLLVDDAIIAVEMMTVQLEKGLNRIDAACYAFRATAKPMLTGTLITCAGFIPVAFSDGAAAEFCKALFPVITAALVLSWIVSVMVAPLFGYYLIKPKKKERGEEEKLYTSRFYVFFRKVLTWCLTHRVIVIGGTAAAFVLSAGLTYFIPKEFFPPSLRPELIVEMTLPEGSSMEATQKEASRLAQYLDG
ncbi:MAG: efflux RND transporter permease subunit, partial [Megasphaera sp.]|nr:efflux RND transporter permease subunit [Megasphaera sp.]